ncbi:hypothetical protein PV797_00865 [Clostridiaceae bacterium M8S5]|nr:hypothetical protein PV797_00865 [Clostridiaceae bacterium M8S5]
MTKKKIDGPDNRHSGVAGISSVSLVARTFSVILIQVMELYLLI